MTEYRFTVTVTTDTPEHAVWVMAERTGFDEAYDDHEGQEFDYQIDWSIPDGDGRPELSRACRVFYNIFETPADPDDPQQKGE